MEGAYTLIYFICIYTGVYMQRGVDRQTDRQTGKQRREVRDDHDHDDSERFEKSRSTLHPLLYKFLSLLSLSLVSLLSLSISVPRSFLVRRLCLCCCGCIQRGFYPYRQRSSKCFQFIPRIAITLTSILCTLS